MALSKVGQFRGHPMLYLSFDDDTPEDKPFTFGVRKAMLILDGIADIVEFVEKHGGDEGKKVITEFYGNEEEIKS